MRLDETIGIPNFSITSICIDGIHCTPEFRTLKMSFLHKLATGNDFLRKSRQLAIQLPHRCNFHGCFFSIGTFTRRKYCVTVLRYGTTNTLKRNFTKTSISSTFKQRSKKSEFKRLMLLAAPEKWRLSGAIAFLAVSSVVTMAVPFCLGRIIDVIYTLDKEQMQKNLNKLCIVFIAIFLLGGVCNFGRIYFMSTSAYRITQSLRREVYAAILSQETAMFDKKSTGELVGRLTGDAQLVSSAVTSNISDGLRSAIMTGAGIFMMFYVSPQLALVGLSIVPPVAGIAILYGRLVKKISKNVQDSQAELNAIAEERISNIRTVKAFGQEEREVKVYSKKLEGLLAVCYKESLYRALFFGFTGLSGNAIILSVLYYGGVMVSDAALSVGNLSSFLLYAAYVGISLNGLSSFYSEFNKALGASTRLFELIDRHPKISIKGGQILQRELTGEIVFRNIDFSYPTREETWVLRNFNLHISKCSTTAVVGPSGSGKSTIAHLLLRLYDPNEGSILLDDHDLKTLDPAWVKLQIGIVSQEPTLFSGSIRENICYGTENVTEAEIECAAKEANVLKFTEHMRAGLDTIVGERGITLSGGQRQRVAIARALIKKPKILILDEATSALDAENESLVQEALERATHGKTVLTIAHRLSTIRNADKIAVLECGQIVETGTYDELMAREDGVFRKLVKHQTFA
ncbi:ATP-binding cassette sub-family B member 10, mitochondrial [Cephus cinctus]|uniref:ATP-binding cassette sub-family B member 10, mitochondrial n=1 Tax=Cephus cinctus TaxID=211228 RepID=A0AAJ7BJZ6_CEPCN|nr:ATP-binding cassette sub-family B member 10, mitochondrial [Cephus cinctus]